MISRAFIRVLALGDLGDLDIEADTAAARHLGGGRRETGRPEVAECDEQLPFSSSRHASMSRLLLERIPHLDAGTLVLGLSSSNSWLASVEAPPIPSRPVVEPMSRIRLPGPAATARVRSSARMSPSDIALIRQLPEYASSK